MTITAGLRREFDNWTDQGAYFRLEQKILKISGIDAPDFLHRMTTNQVKLLPLDTAQETTLLQGDGRMTGHGVLHRADVEVFYLVCQSEAFEGIRAQLDKFLFREDVQLKDVSSEYSVFHILAPQTSFVPELETSALTDLDASFAADITPPVMLRMCSPALVNWLRKNSDWIRMAS